MLKGAEGEARQTTRTSQRTNQLLHEFGCAESISGVVFACMKITPDAFDAYLKCQTKYWLRAAGEVSEENHYAQWVKTQTDSYRVAETTRMVADLPDSEVDQSPSVENTKSATWRLATGMAVQAEMGACVLESELHAVERVLAGGRGKAAQFIPIRFIFTNKLDKDDKLLLAFDALALGKTLGREIGLGKIVHGENHATLKVKTSALAGEVRKRVEKITALISNPEPPDLILKRHCAECEYQAQCRKVAVDKDELSLLSGMNAKDRKKLHSKGIFTVTQLSYTFRPRRRPKRMRDKREKYHPSLKALAIREKKIHIVGSPELKIEGTPVYLDVEGLPDHDFYYLIGLRIGNGESAVQYSLWADTDTDEEKIWRKFLTLLETIEKPVLIHYGSYETTFMRRMMERYGDPSDYFVAEKGLSSVNLLSVIFAQIYFPVFSNGLKDTAGFLGFTWANADMTGLNSIAFRHRWNQLRDQTTKLRLLAYNAQDCEALSLVTERVGQLVGQLTAMSTTEAGGADVVLADAEQFERKSKWGDFTSSISGFEKINAAAHWDYQRHRIYSRSNSSPKKLNPPHPRKLKLEQAQLVVDWPVSRRCPKCQRRVRSKGMEKSRTIHDAIFGRQSLKLRVVRHIFHTYQCSQCRIQFGIDQRFRLFRQYGWNLVSYLFFQQIELNIPQLTVTRHLNRLFHFNLTRLLQFGGSHKVRILY